MSVGSFELLIPTVELMEVRLELATTITLECSVLRQNQGTITNYNDGHHSRS